MNSLTKSVEAPQQKLGPYEYETVRSSRWFQIAPTSDDFVFLMFVVIFCCGLVTGAVFS